MGTEGRFRMDKATKALGRCLFVARAAKALPGHRREERDTLGWLAVLAAHSPSRFRALGGGVPGAGKSLSVCPNCEQWQRPENGGDCTNECARRGFAPYAGAAA